MAIKGSERDVGERQAGLFLFSSGELLDLLMLTCVHVLCVSYYFIFFSLLKFGLTNFYVEFKMIVNSVSCIYPSREERFAQFDRTHHKLRQK